ncbi:NuoM family protein [Buchnera aphidicola]|uniref:complex I subunit 4 family protein n=1 Tax=Buchnera aphidicola TaxID=9 RepID=UPI0034639307
MILLLLIILPLLGGFFSWKSETLGKKIPRFVVLFFSVINLFLIIKLFYENNYFLKENMNSIWNEEISISWMKTLGISLHLGIDSLSWLMIFLTAFLSFISILLTWNEKIRDIGLFYFFMMCIVSNMIGMFLSLDLFLFFVFWEIVSIPIYFLMIYWGRQYEKNYNICCSIANRYLIYSQISGFILLISILGLVINNYDVNHVLTFDYNLLRHSHISIETENLLMFGFVLSFFIKIPVIPFHSWFPNFQKNTPISGSFDLIGIVIKISIYSLLRFSLFLFPRASYNFSQFFYFIGLLCIFYGIFLSFSQKSIKKIIAYTSISHMGFILISIYSGSFSAFQGIFIQFFSYTLSTSGLIILTRILYRNFKTDNFEKMGGLWNRMFYLPGFFLFFVMANLGIPGTGNFVGEYFMLYGVFTRHPIIVFFSMLGLILLSILFLEVFHKIFYGISNDLYDLKYQISYLEFFILLFFMFLLIFMGFLPNFYLKIFEIFIVNIMKVISPFTIIYR